jgi:hypothetical protein
VELMIRHSVAGLVGLLPYPEVTYLLNRRRRWTRDVCSPWVKHQVLTSGRGVGQPTLLRFAKGYLRRAAVRQLEELGADWTMLQLTFAVRDRQERHALLAQAVRERWSPERLRFEVQQRHPTRRQGVGGRTPRDPQGFGPEPRCASWSG